MTGTKKTTDSVSPMFFLQVMNHWATPCLTGSVLSLSLLLLCSGPWGIALGVGVSFSGMIYSAVRFFGSRKSSQALTQQPFSPESKLSIYPPSPVGSSTPVLDVDSLERYLTLLYGVEPELLQQMQTQVMINPHSPLITGVYRIRERYHWGTELHVHYLSDLFDVPYRVFTVSGGTRGDASGYVAHFNLGKTDCNPLEGLNYIQLINHGGIHWTTVLGTEPLVGEEEQRTCLDNPAGGDCLFYAFSLGLAKYMCHDVSSAKEMKQSAIFQRWRKLDPGMKERGRATAFFNLGKAASPLKDVRLHAAWDACQRSLRHLVADYMGKQLIAEGGIALDSYQSMFTNQDTSPTREQCVIELYNQSPLYREFNLLYNLDKKNKFGDLATNIFQELHPMHRSMSYNMSYNI
ncbi:MAG: hypothetical protein P1U39_03990 [Legionellaceae bacterium]|nr:hypothetical protein [Legionellaceae bacterium]